MSTGGCLCGAVRYEVRGALRGILICHCDECLRWSGNAFAATAAAREDLVVLDDASLRFIASPASASNARRGFCAECGSSLFWDAPRASRVSIAAGSLDDASELTVVGHVYVSQAPRWDVLPDDGLPRHDRLIG
jgi:hypothetical protein